MTETKKPDNWKEMTPEQKRAHRLEVFRKTSDSIDFINEEAKANYIKRVQRYIDVYNVHEPDRIPLEIDAGVLPLTMNGLTVYDAFYNIDKALPAYKKFNDEYSNELELFATPMMASPGKALEILDYKLYAWPGHGLPKNAGWQFIEGEYMTVDEYDDLVRDPSDFWLRTYLPRVFGAFDGFKEFDSLTNINENIHVSNFAPFANPKVRTMLKKFLDAGEIFEKFGPGMFSFHGTGSTYGFPAPVQLFCKAPFDIIGDTLRGTTNIMKDMFRCPDKLLKALDVVADFYIANVLNSRNVDKAQLVMFPLHKGADGWMSQKQFDTFYWPTLKRVMDTFINEGLIQGLFAEGSYSSRLHCIDQFPKGFTLWFFDRTDMGDVKKALGKNCTIKGNIPSSLLVTGKPDDVKSYCRKLIEVAGKDGGYIMSPGSNAENPKIENLRAVAETLNEYGYYK